MKLGKFELNIISDGRFKLDGGAMFGIVPKVIWNSAYECDEHNRITLALDCLIVRYDDRIVLLEAGMGEKFSKKEEKIYAIDRRGGIPHSLKGLDLRPDMITDVIPSHLHFDHAGFLTRREGEGLVPSFPNAICHLQKSHYEWAISASAKDSASFKKDDITPLSDTGLIKLHDGPWEMCRDFDFFISNGHTPHQQHARIKGDKSSLIFCGDLIPTSRHIKPSYNMGYDNQPVENSSEKEKLLKEAAQNGSMLYFYHDPDTKLITVKRTEKGFVQQRAIPFD